MVVAAIARDHARSGAAAAPHALRRFDFRPRALSPRERACVGRIRPEDQHPISRALIRVYEPVASVGARAARALVLAAAGALLIATVPVAMRLGRSSCRRSTRARSSTCRRRCRGSRSRDAQRLLQATDRVIKQFPEVDRVLGKAGRADTPTDPAPLSMLETVITLQARVRSGAAWTTWYSAWAPDWVSAAASSRHARSHLARSSSSASSTPRCSFPACRTRGRCR